MPRRRFKTRLLFVFFALRLCVSASEHAQKTSIPSRWCVGSLPGQSMLPGTAIPIKPVNGTPGRGTKGRQTRQARYKGLVVITIILVALTVLVDTGRRGGRGASEPPEPGRHGGGDPGSGHPLSHLKHLVLVACHSVYTVGTMTRPRRDTGSRMLAWNSLTGVFACTRS